MREARVDTNWCYRGLRALILENRWLRVTVLPELGAKILDFVYKPRDRNLLWRHPRVQPRAVPFGAGYDDVWPGGWDDLFPNALAETLEGDRYPDHGEVWALAWDWAVLQEDAGGVTIGLWCTPPVTAARVEKKLHLPAEARFLRVEHLITNQGLRPFAFHLTHHVALPLTPATRLCLPSSTVVVDPDWPGRLDPTAAPSAWPVGRDRSGRSVDLSVVPPASARVADLFYATNLASGWCAAIDADDRLGLGLAFDPHTFTGVWCFASYGGWRSLYTAVLEPTTGYPGARDRALEQGTCAVVAPGETFASALEANPIDGPTSVTGVRWGGDVDSPRDHDRPLDRGSSVPSGIQA